MGVDLLSVAARALVRAPFGRGPSRGVVGVGRLYEQRFDDAEAALLEAVAASIEPALERLRLAEERDQLYREAHERGQAARVIGSIADGVLLVDDAGIVQLWNPAAEAITGLPADVVLGRPLKEAIPGWSAIADSLVVAGDAAPSSGRATTVPIDFGGREVWLSISGVGFAEGTVYAFRDLTEDHQLEQLKADFIATVSHELRTPLAAVHGAAQTLNREDVVVGGDVFRQLLSLISEQSQRLSRMVEDILLASRVDSPALQIATEQVDVTPLAAEVIATARVHAGEAADARTRRAAVAADGEGRPRQAAADPHEPRRERRQVLTGGRSHRSRTEGTRRAPRHFRPRRGHRDCARGPAVDLREVLSRRREHDPRCERQWPRPLHLPRALASHGREDRGRVRARCWLDVRHHAAGRASRIQRQWNFAVDVGLTP